MIEGVKSDKFRGGAAEVKGNFLYEYCSKRRKRLDSDIGSISMYM